MVMMAANNETGVLQPWGAVRDICTEARVPFLCDAAQWIGKLPAAGLGESDYLTACAIDPVIPPKSNRKVKGSCDFVLYCERNLVERFFCIIKHFQAIATRYEITARNFLAGLHLVYALVWLE